MYPGLHQEKHDQQVKGGDSAPLICSHDTPPGVLRSVLGPSTQEGHGAVGVGPVEGHGDDQRAGAPPLWEQAERDGALQFGEEKALRGPHSSISVPEGGLQERWEGLFRSACSERMRGNGFRLEEGRFRLDIEFLGRNYLLCGW